MRDENCYADDHDVIRTGLKGILKIRPDWQVVAEAENGQDALQYVKDVQPDVAILDMSMPAMDGLAAAHEINKLKGSTRVLLLTMHPYRGIKKMIEASGAAGYVLKANAATTLVKAIEEIIAGRPFFPESQSAAITPHGDNAGWVGYNAGAVSGIMPG
jgi:DNA-binding NarL/FixJ family response regulator